MLQFSLWGCLLSFHFIFERSSHDFDHCLIELLILGVALGELNAWSWKSSWFVYQISAMAESEVEVEHLLHCQVWIGVFKLCHYHSLELSCYSDLDLLTSGASKLGWEWNNLWFHVTSSAILTFQACRPLSTCMYLRKARESLDRRPRNPSRASTSLGRIALGTFPCWCYGQILSKSSKVMGLFSSWTHSERLEWSWCALVLWPFPDHARKFALTRLGCQYWWHPLYAQQNIHNRSDNLL